MKYKAMKFWIGDDSELSKKVQNILFGMGYLWAGEDSPSVGETNQVSLYTSENGRITFASGDDPVHGYFADSINEEINIEWMRSIKTETIELNGKTYIKSELEEALRHIKPVGEE